MAHLAAHPTPADDLPLFARGSPPAQLRTVPFLDSNAPFPALSSVEVDADLLVRAMGAHCFLQWVIKRAEDFSQPIGTLWHRWAPQMWDFTNTTIRRLTSDVFSARGVMEISKGLGAAFLPVPNAHDGQEPAGFQDALTQLEGRYRHPSQLMCRLCRLSAAAAKDAFLQQMHYVETWLPGEPLVAPVVLPSACHPRSGVDDACTSRKKLEAWRRKYLEHHAQQPTWSGAEMPHDARKRGTWPLGAVQSYWKRHGGAFLDDWKRLDDARVELVKEYCMTEMLPHIDSVIMRSLLTPCHPQRSRSNAG
ncbi:hypothetical protein JCM10295v2_005724 [Rhodotorula toruloides]